MEDDFFDDTQQQFRASVREYIKRSVTPHYEQWEADHLIDRAAWEAAGDAGMLGMGVSSEYGGSDEPDYRYRMIVSDELALAAASSLNAGISVQDDIVIPYLDDLANEEQKQRWLPGLVGGRSIGAIAMTEPGAGSDLQGLLTTAVRDGDDWLINGQKTFITNGIHADLVIVVARTDPDAGSRGFSLFVVERDTPGFERGRKLDKVGLWGQDTAELFFSSARVPNAHLLGEPGAGFRYLMERLPRERLSIAAGALGASQAAMNWTADYVFERKAFGGRIGDLQNTRFVLAELETEIDITRAYVQQAALALNAGKLTTVEASKAKWWASELQVRVTDRCLQLFGGYGYMNEYPIGRAYRDARVQTIYGGTTEIMKEIIGKDLGL